jgi:hypothetical protein
VEKLERKRPLGRPRRRWEDTIKWVFKKQDAMAWTGQNWHRMETNSSVAVSTVMNLRVQSNAGIF